MFHVAIILDGNGRWAAQRNLPRLAGHKQGAEAVRRVTTAAPSFGVTDLTVYAFSSDNWKRPQVETAGLMFLLKEFLDLETPRCIENGVRVWAIGRRDRLPDYVRAAVADCEAATRGGGRLNLRIALDYSSRDTLLEAVRGGAETREAVSSRLPAPDVDLLIRTAGEQRLSDFLLWECAYAEFHFSPKLWPDFTGQDLAAAVADFRGRNRRFGTVPAGWCEVPA